MHKKLLRGEIWIADFDPIVGREQAKKRPCLILSTNAFNQGFSELCIVVPLTTKNKDNPLHIRVCPPEGGLTSISYILCEHVKSISQQRFIGHSLGRVSDQTLQQVEHHLKVLLNFS